MRLTAKTHSSKSVRLVRPSRLQVHALTVGIDLGTTNSSIAVVKGGNAEIVHLKDSSSTNLPSAVFYEPSGSLRVGKAAQTAAQSSPLNLVYSAKRIIGRTFSDPQVQEQLGRVSYKVSKGANDETLLSVPNRSEPIRPVEVSTEVLKALVAAAEAQYGEKVEKAIIAVPVNFGPQQREATREAAKLAGIPSVGLLQEPVAAAVAYGAGRTTEADVILVFDLGGGTFDVSVLQDFEGIVEVLGTDGDGYLGGNDMDSVIVKRLMSSLNGSASSSNQEELRAVLVSAAEELKLQLAIAGAAAGKDRSGQAASTSVVLPGPEGKKVELTLGNDEFERDCTELREKMMKPLERIGIKLKLTWKAEPWRPGQEPLTHARVDRFAPPPRKVTRVVLVGAAVRTPWVMDIIRETTGLEPDLKVNPEHAVALGAAMYGGGLEGSISSFELLDGAYNSNMHGRASGWEP